MQNDILDKSEPKSHFIIGVEVYYKLDKLLIGLTSQQSVVTAR